MPDTRDAAALRRHYEIETALARRLRTASVDDRLRMYREIYNELFRQVPDHPQNTWKVDAREQAARTKDQFRLLDRFLTPESVYLEIGAGDCHLANSVAARCRFAYGVDVSDEMMLSTTRLLNFLQLCSDGRTIPAPDGCVDVAYSNMLIEHLHPDDVDQHFKEVARILVPGGVYVCRTPHRFTGPQDISQHFDREATGLHMKEYTVGELSDLARQAGFASIETLAEVKGRSVRCPMWVVRTLEMALGMLPQRTRKSLCKSAPLRPLFRTITLVAQTHSGKRPVMGVPQI